MKSMQLSRLATFCDARLTGDDIPVSAVAIDSRSLKPGALFIALRGERFDGHEFAAEAVANGAVAVLCEHPLSVPAPQLVVGDTREALGRIAAGMAAQRETKLIGITGSNGKTTVKTLLAAILSRAGRCYANPGNRNNEIGLPLALSAHYYMMQWSLNLKALALVASGILLLAARAWLRQPRPSGTAGNPEVAS